MLSFTHTKNRRCLYTADVHVYLVDTLFRSFAKTTGNFRLQKGIDAAHIFTLRY